jgi:hypothetical protein
MTRAVLKNYSDVLSMLLRLKQLCCELDSYPRHSIADI